ncbi:hypothetical protein GQ464_008830 [Rhodocaloribacter litoris]|uniref:hypothetical protein n=1 Tax=Rhodocaloribacter litoris TaxID=2558931 RepID=UPI0014207B06|nr:hypothetical protein [Rhodocaloribacter litoris]QXD17019.1 hypothetical protein GQ464_008830 [Rhodocaloribacter litoris]
MTRTEALQTIRRHAGELLVVHFTKRTDGTHRRMVCIFNPEAAEREAFRFNPAARGLVPVWDVEKGGRRFVNLDGVESIQVMKGRPRNWTQGPSGRVGRVTRPLRPYTANASYRAPMPPGPRPRTWAEARIEAHQLF